MCTVLQSLMGIPGVLEVARDDVVLHHLVPHVLLLGVVRGLVIHGQLVAMLVVARLQLQGLRADARCL